MNRNVVHQSSPVQQMMAAGGPNWWNNNNMRPPNLPPQHSSPFLVHPPPNLLPQHTSSWNDNQELPDHSWSQLLMGGIVSGEDKSGGLSHMQQQDKKLEIWEEQLLHQQAASNGSNSCVKQENSYHIYGTPTPTTTSTTTTTTTNHGFNNAEFQQPNSATAKPSYSQVLNMPVSSPTSCVTSLSSNMLDFSNNKMDGKHPPPDRSSECNSTGTGGVAKKARVQPSSTQSTFKVRKEKLGDRITALHQLVSPFGKTDTASVLLEALGYIRFLQSQIEALSLPYLGSGRSGNNMSQQQSERNEEGIKDLRSKGLCLVPISCTVEVGSDNGADYWAPAAAAFGGSF